jgi:16S rRNA (guanine(966)-N(2))-methyltransferase RsmD
MPPVRSGAGCLHRTTEWQNPHVPTSPTRRAPLRKPSADSVAAATPGEIRLIGGRWKRSKLPVADHPGLRPTPDRVRETLFNWLGQDLAGWRVLDAFAGTGALGFEAASRGATEVLLLEHDQQLALHLQTAARRLGATAVRVVRAEALGWMARREVSDLDLVLLDPPFGADVFDAAVRAALPLLTPEGWLYLESDRAFDAQACAAWGCRLHRQGRAGMVHFHLLQRSIPGTTDYTGA